MGRDLFDLFRYKSKKEEEKELAAYAAWAFPYGEAQRGKVMALLSQLLPKEDASIAMVIFLIGKEAFCDKDGEFAADGARSPIQDAAAALGKSGMRVKKEHLPLYLALILADSQVDERLIYPEVQTLAAMAQGLL